MWNNVTFSLKKKNNQKNALWNLHNRFECLSENLSVLSVLIRLKVLFTSACQSFLVTGVTSGAFCQHSCGNAAPSFPRRSLSQRPLVAIFNFRVSQELVLTSACAQGCVWP